MNHLSDALVAQFNQGDPHAFQVVFDCFRVRIFYFVKKMIDDRQTAEEITSDTFVKLYNLKERFTAHLKIQAFLFITARNASVDFLKHKSKERERMIQIQNIEEQEMDLPFFAETNIEADVLNFLYKEIEKLPERARIIFKLSYIEGLSVPEISKIMKISQQTVANQKSTALKIMRMKTLDRPDLLLFIITALGESKVPICVGS